MNIDLHRFVRSIGSRDIWRRVLLPLIVLTLAACGGTGPKTGGYYQNDGPGSRSAAEFSQISDAIPRDEPIVSASLRPYTALGRKYVPNTERKPFRQSGVASWYGKQFQGRPTAIGDKYDMYGMTGAHPTLPLPSYVRVRNLSNNKTVVIRVNDRGPFSNGRIIDLSFAAAAKLGYTQKGTALVSIQVVDPAVLAMEQNQIKPAKPVIARSSRKARALPPRAAVPAVASLPVPGFPQAKPKTVNRARQTQGVTPKVRQTRTVTPTLASQSNGRDRSGQRTISLRPNARLVAPAVAQTKVTALSTGVRASSAAVAVKIETIQDQGLRPAIAEPDLDRRVSKRDPLKPRDWSRVNATPAKRAETKQIAAISAEARRFELNEKSAIPDEALIFLQFGAYSSEKAAREDIYRHSGTFNSLYLPVEIVVERGLHKIQAGPFANAKAAKAAIKQFQLESSLKPFYVFR